MNESREDKIIKLLKCQQELVNQAQQVLTAIEEHKARSKMIDFARKVVQEEIDKLWGE